MSSKQNSKKLVGLIKHDKNYNISYIIEKCIGTDNLYKMLPSLVKNKIDDFNKLQEIENFSLVIKAFSLRDIIEAFVISLNEKFYIKNLSDFIRSKDVKMPDKDFYLVLLSMLNNVIHINPFPIMNTELFSTVCALIDNILCENLFILSNKEDISNILSTTQTNILTLNNMASWIVDLKKINENTINQIEELPIENITNKYNFQSAIVYIIGCICKKNSNIPYKCKSDDANKVKRLLISSTFKIPENEIEEQYLKDSCDLIEKYTKQKSTINAIYNNLEKLNKDTINQIKNLQIDNITNKDNFYNAITKIISNFYSEKLKKKDKKDKFIPKDIKQLKDFLISEYKMPEDEIQEQYLQASFNLIEEYGKAKNILDNKYINYGKVNKEYGKAKNILDNKYINYGKVNKEYPKLTLEKNAILCLEEALEKYKQSKENKEQYIFAIKNLQDFIHIYCKYIIDSYSSKLTKKQQNTIKNDEKWLNSLEFGDTVSMLCPEECNSNIKLFNKLKKYTITDGGLREIRNKLTHYTYDLILYDFDLFHIIVVKFDDFIKSSFNISLEDSCENLEKSTVYKEILKMHNSYLDKIIMYIRDKNWDSIEKDYNHEKLMEIYTYIVHYDKYNKDYDTINEQDTSREGKEKDANRENKEEYVKILLTHFMKKLYTNNPTFMNNITEYYKTPFDIQRGDINLTCPECATESIYIKVEYDRKGMPNIISDYHCFMCNEDIIIDNPCEEEDDDEDGNKIYKSGIKGCLRCGSLTNNPVYCNACE